jgi:phenylpropionate dioxygenase-like ring-hydroxylating dioxygenase large terminal subunit
MTRWNNGSDEIGTVSTDVTSETNALPTKYFTDPDVFEMEKEKVFGQYWIYAGHKSAISEPGSYFTRTIGDKQIIITRSHDGKVRTFYNVCAHRGSKMLEDTPMTDPGNLSRITCPYHLWTYELDGDLVSTPKSFEEATLNPGIDDDEIPELDPQENGLMEVNTDSIGPLIFVNFADEPRLSLANQAGSMKSELEELPIGEYQLARRYVSEVECNWKTFGSNYSECDHCAANHQDWISGVEIGDSELEVNDYHWILHYKYKEEMDDEVRIHEQEEGRFYYFWPNFSFNLYGTADGYGTYYVDPIDEGRIQLVADYYFKDTDLTEDEEELIRTSRQLQEEDFEIVERQHEGLKTGALAQGQLGPNEHSVHRLHQIAQEAYNA